MANRFNRRSRRQLVTDKRSIEALEARRMLSVTTASGFGQHFEPGASLTLQASEGSQSETDTEGYQGAATFNGVAGSEFDMTVPSLKVLSGLGSITTAGNSVPVKPDRLVFIKKPATADVAVPLTFTIAVENSRHQIDTNANSGGVTLSFARGKAATGQLSAYTDTGFVNGVDTFTAPNSPSFNFPGAYTITASQIDASGSTATEAKPASAPVHILGLHIKLAVPPPADVPLLQYVSAKVEVVDSRGRVDTTVSDYLNVTAGNPDASILVQGTPQFTDGVYEFSATSANIDNTMWFALTEATSTLKFTAGFQPSVANDPSIAAAISGPIRITGYHLVYQVEPANATIRDAIPFKLAIEDDHGKILANNADYASNFPGEQVQISSSPAGAVLEDYNTPAVFNNSVLDFPAIQPDGTYLQGTVLAGPNAGTYDLTASVIYSNIGGYNGNGPIPFIASKASKKFKTLPPPLGFVTAPVGTSVSFVLPAFSVQVENVDGTLQPSYNGELLDVSYRLTKGGPVHLLGQMALVNGVASFQLYNIPDPGHYRITVSEDPGSVTSAIPPFTSAVSQPFTMSP